MASKFVTLLIYFDDLCDLIMADGSGVCIGIDIGTQGCKALALDLQNNAVIGRGEAQYGIIPSSVQGRAEQHPDTWIQGMITAVHEVLKQIPSTLDVRAIGISGQQHGMVVLDQGYKVLRPCKLWCDTESAAEASELSKALGRTVVPSFTITKLLWFKRHEPATFEKLAHVLLPHDYVNWWLCGRLCMEAGDASGTGLLDVVNKHWDHKAIFLVDERIADFLPPLVGPNEVIGTLTPEAARQLGLHTNVKVSPGSGDNAMAALGAGLATPGPLVMSLGTSGTLFGKSPQPFLDPTGIICPFCDATGGGLPLLCTLNCTVPVQEVANAFNTTHQQLTELAEKEPPGCHGLTFLPYLIGERTPNWPTATGSLLGLRPGLLRPGLLYRAALEGVTFSLLAGARMMQNMGLHPTELKVVGGGAKNQLWRQIIADAFQLPVRESPNNRRSREHDNISTSSTQATACRQPTEVESAALGAALQAAACNYGVTVADYVEQHPPAMIAEVVQPNVSLKEAYETAFERFQKLGRQLQSE